MKLLKNEQIPVKQWESLLLTSPFASPFQSSEYFCLFRNGKNLKTKAFAISENGHLLALCVVTLIKERGWKSQFSHRGVIFGGPLLLDNISGKNALAFLLKSVNKHLRKDVIYVETRNSHNYHNFDSEYYKAGWRYKPHLNVLLNLKNKTLDDTLNLMSYNRRREIQGSLKQNVVLKQADSLEEIKQLYYILKDLYRRKVKLPIPEFDFFEKMFLSPIGKVFIVKHNNKIIGGAFCLYLADRTVYTMYYCGMREYNRKIYPTHLAIYSAIKFGIENSCEIIDLMGAGKPEEAYGVREYKKQFGGELVKNGRFLKVFQPLKYLLGIIGVNLLKSRFL